MKNEDRIHVVLQDMPERVSGLTTCVCDGGEDYYTVVLNSKLSHERQHETMLHELRHIVGNDFESEKDPNELEAIRHDRR